MVLPEPLIAAIKARASARHQSVTAYITTLVQLDLMEVEADAGTPASAPLGHQLRALEQRIARLEAKSP